MTRRRELSCPIALRFGSSFVFRLAAVAFFVSLATSHSPLVCYAQSTNAAIEGRITDPAKATIPGAIVEVINTGTNWRYETKTDNGGSYLVVSLAPGNYRVEVEKQGFKSIVKPDVVLHVQDTVELNFEMVLGSASESITVGAADPTSQGITVYGEEINMNTTDASVSTTIDRNFAENLPLNGRSFQTLILLTPGTVLVPAVSSGANGGGNGGQFSVNGQRANSNNFTVDGISSDLGGYTRNFTDFSLLNGANPTLTYFGSTQGLVPVDALQEFKIQTSTYSPEFGRQPGGQVSLLTRSGANDWHGTAFDYVRNDVLDASNWFNDAHNPPLAKAKERQNDFGGTLGGPIVRDKTFFFFSYEGLRLLQPFSENDTVPSLRLRQEASTDYQAILNSWPTPSGPELTMPNPVSGQPPIPTGAAPYTLDTSLPTNLDTFSIRIDHTIGKSTHLFGRYSHTNSTNVVPNLDNFQDAVLANALRSQTVTIGMDNSINPSLQNELRLNYADSDSTSDQNLITLSGAKPYDTSVLFPAPLVRGTDLPFWEVSLPSFYTFISEPGRVGLVKSRQIAFTDNVSHSTGSHQLKWGVDYRRLFPTDAPAPVRAQYAVTSENDLIAGVVSRARTFAQAPLRPVYVNLSFYGQDSWRVSNRLTVTYGLRWDLNPVPIDRGGLDKFFLNLVGIGNPAGATLAPEGSALFRTAYDNFAPRFGLAYQLRQSPGRETVLRGGFGVFYDLSSEAWAQAFGNSSAFSNRTNFVRGLPFPVPNNTLTIAPLPVPENPPYVFIGAVDPNLRLPYTLEWNVSVEQSLGRNQSLTASYVASSGRRLLRSDDIFNFSSTYEEVGVLRNASASNYQSLQLQFNRRLSWGLQALAGYTYSHSIDNASNAETVLSINPSGPSLPNPNVDRGNSDFDLRHAFRAAVTYNIPTWHANSVSRSILGGWSLDSIGIAQTGTPVDLVGGQYFTNNYDIYLRPDVVPGQPRYLYGAQCVLAFGSPCPGGMAFNPAAFSPVPTDQNGNPIGQGNLGRNVMRGFGAWQMDFALHRQFNLTDRINLQFRGEMFNVFNHPNFGGIDNFLGDAGSFGLAHSTLNKAYGSGLNYLYQIGGPRSVQLALKLVF